MDDLYVEMKANRIYDYIRCKDIKHVVVEITNNFSEWCGMLMLRRSRMKFSEWCGMLIWKKCMLVDDVTC